MKQFVLWLAGISATLVTAGFIVASLGLIPVAASSGHWAITSWFLHFTMRQSVQTRSLTIEVPELADPSLILRGAGHFATGCAPCHGAPGVPASAITKEMTPHPPELTKRIAEWQPEELFWIVKHGVKFTGMPAWVAQQRDDEVWAVTAFLLRLPNLTPDAYRQLTHGEHNHDTQDIKSLQESTQSILKSCARCHHMDGSGRGNGAFPRLDGQSEDYLFATLQAYAEGQRFSGIMQPVAVELNQTNMRQLAHYFAAQKNVTIQATADTNPAAIRRGEVIAKQGIPKRGVPSCVHCHGPSKETRNPYYPLLAGQYAEYLILQLELFQKNQRGGSPFSPIMNTAAHRLEPQQMEDVAAYYASISLDSVAK